MTNAHFAEQHIALCYWTIAWIVQAVLVDMEEGVVSEVMKGPLSDVFDHRQLITDVSGSGNNWLVLLVTVVLILQTCVLCI